MVRIDAQRCQVTGEIVKYIILENYDHENYLSIYLLLIIDIVANYSLHNTPCDF